MVIQHSDHGTQYTALTFGERCQERGVQPSRGTVGDAYDHAMAGSIFAMRECERIGRRTDRTMADARLDLFHYIEGWYNPRPRHSALEQMAPMRDEQRDAAVA